MKKSLIVSCLFLVMSCGPGVKDGSLHITGGYHFFFFGGNQNFIKNVDDSSKPSIEPRVEQFFFHGNIIFVSRTPVTYVEKGDTLEGVLGNECEYWMINVVNDQLSGPFKRNEIINMSKWKELNKALANSNLEQNSRCPLRI